MKYLILLFFTISTAMACQVSIPESYVPTFLNPPVSGHYMKCEEKPDEACYCVDSVDPWTSVLVDNYINGAPVYGPKKNQTECESVEACEALRQFLCLDKPNHQFFYAANLILPGYEAYCTEILRYEQVLSGKKLVQDPVKLAAYLRSQEDKKALEEAEKLKRKLIKDKLKAIKKSDLTSNAKTVDVVMDIIELVKE